MSNEIADIPELVTDNKPGRPTSGRGSWTGWYLLTVLTIVTLFANVDRQVLILQAEPIRLALKLTDTQLGLLQGTGIAIFTAAATYPIAWLADRIDRRVVLALCLLVWSVSVVACGAAAGFISLMFAGSMVGAGEAGLVPVSYSAIPDHFDGRRRQLANSVFSLAAGTGAALASIIAGQLIAAVGHARPSLPLGLSHSETWRLGFWAAAAPAPIMLLLIVTLPGVRRLLKKPRATGSGEADSGLPELGPFFRRHMSAFLRLFSSFAAQGLGFGAVTSWLVVICMRQFGQTAQQVGAGMGVGILLALPVGFGASLLLTRWLSPRFGRALPFRLLGITYGLSGVLMTLLLFARVGLHVYLLTFVIYAILVAGAMTAPTAIQNLAPARFRGRIFALQSLIGVGATAAAPPLVGAISDQLKSLSNGLLVSAVALSVPLLLLAAALMLWSEPRLVRATDDAEEFDRAFN